ncbi:MAG: hypothetical protein HDS79_03220 [Bacteroidales bacterium]|nr:hypothetical protein [Bacteroidales bacterium]
MWNVEINPQFLSDCYLDFKVFHPGYGKSRDPMYSNSEASAIYGWYGSLYSYGVVDKF